MSRYVRWLGFGLIVMAVGVMPAWAEMTCGRNCLRTILDDYLAAVVKHDATAAPLVVGFRQTENAINVRPGDGVWKTVTALGKVQRRYLDPVSGQGAYYGTVEEGSNTSIVTVRVRVENRQLTEAEWYLARADDPGRDGRQRQPGSPPVNLHSVVGVTRNDDHLTRGRRRLAAAKKSRSVDRSAGRQTCRRSTASSWRSTLISSSLNSVDRNSRQIPHCPRSPARTHYASLTD
jgi:hypothetical protein